MFSDCSANIPRLVTDHRRIFAEHFSRQNIANGSQKKFNASIENLGHREMLHHEYHEFHDISDYSPKVWLYLPNIA